MGNFYKALLSQKSRKFDVEIQLIVPKSTRLHNRWDWIYVWAKYRERWSADYREEGFSDTRLAVAAGLTSRIELLPRGL